MARPGERSWSRGRDSSWPSIAHHTAEEQESRKASAGDGRRSILEGIMNRTADLFDPRDVAQILRRLSSGRAGDQGDRVFGAPPNRPGTATHALWALTSSSSYGCEPDRAVNGPGASGNRPVEASCEAHSPIASRRTPGHRARPSRNGSRRARSAWRCTGGPGRCRRLLPAR